MTISTKSQRALDKYGYATCLAAYAMNKAGEGASTVSHTLAQEPTDRAAGKTPVRTTQQADAAIEAGRELTEHRAEQAKEAELQAARVVEHERQRRAKRAEQRAEREAKVAERARLAALYRHNDGEVLLSAYYETHRGYAEALGRLAALAEDLQVDPARALRDGRQLELLGAEVDVLGGTLDWLQVRAEAGLTEPQACDALDELVTAMRGRAVRFASRATEPGSGMFESAACVQVEVRLAEQLEFHARYARKALVA